MRVAVGDAVVADSKRTLILREQGYEPVYYFPPEDVDFSLLELAHHASPEVTATVYADVLEAKRDTLGTKLAAAGFGV